MNYNDLLMIGYVKDSLVKQGFHMAHVWRGDHRFHHNKVALYNFFGIINRLYGFTKEDAQRHHKFILFETGAAHHIVDDILKWNPSADIKFVMANIVADYGEWKIRKLQQRGIKIFSFDKGDCEKYHLFWYPVLCFYEGNLAQKPIKNDVYFIGKDKKRAEYIKRIYDVISGEGYRCNFKVVLDKNSAKKRDHLQGLHLLEKGIPYDSVLDDIAESSVILDVVQAGQRGLTMRPMEAFFYDKKLITNNVDVKDLPFYKFGNVLIVGDRFEEVAAFLKKPFNHYAESEKYRYTFEKFVELIFCEEKE